jgi:hypothetical protein
VLESSPPGFGHVEYLDAAAAAAQGVAADLGPGRLQPPHHLIECERQVAPGLLAESLECPGQEKCEIAVLRPFQVLHEKRSELCEMTLQDLDSLPCVESLAELQGLVARSHQSESRDAAALSCPLRGILVALSVGKATSYRQRQVPAVRTRIEIEVAHLFHPSGAEAEECQSQVEFETVIPCFAGIEPALDGCHPPLLQKIQNCPHLPARVGPGPN